jgi:hypothetical protein
MNQQGFWLGYVVGFITATFAGALIYLLVWL